MERLISTHNSRLRIPLEIHAYLSSNICLFDHASLSNSKAEVTTNNQLHISRRQWI
jgi:hypothetical protein